MKKVPLIVLCMHGFSWGSANEDTFPETASLRVPRPLINKWIARHDGQDFTVEVFMNRKDCHFTFSMKRCKDTQDPAAPPVLPPSLCHFVATKEVTSHAIGTLTYTDPVTGHTLYLIP